MQLLLTGKLDFVMGYPIRNINAVEQGLPVVSVATIFQKDPQIIIMQPGIESLSERKGGSILVANYADTTFWPALFNYLFTRGTVLKHDQKTSAADGTVVVIVFNGQQENLLQRIVANDPEGRSAEELIRCGFTEFAKRKRQKQL